MGNKHHLLDQRAIVENIITRSIRYITALYKTTLYVLSGKMPLHSIDVEESDMNVERGRVRLKLVVVSSDSTQLNCWKKLEL
jgi:hypothetical protein